MQDNLGSELNESHQTSLWQANSFHSKLFQHVPMNLYIIKTLFVCDLYLVEMYHKSKIVEGTSNGLTYNACKIWNPCLPWN